MRIHLKVTTLLLIIGLLSSGCGIRLKTRHEGWNDSAYATVVCDLIGVRDHAGERVPGVKVRLTRLETGQTRITYTESGSPTELTALPPGRYEVKVSGRPLGAHAVKRIVDLPAGKTVRVTLYDHTSATADATGEVFETAGEVVLISLGVVTVFGLLLVLATLDDDDC